jgi:hypothetical protein
VTEKESWNRNSDAAFGFGTMFRVSKCFNRSKESHYIFFISSTRQHKNLKSIGVHAENNDKIL